MEKIWVKLNSHVNGLYQVPGTQTIGFIHAYVARDGFHTQAIVITKDHKILEVPLHSFEVIGIRDDL